MTIDQSMYNAFGAFFGALFSIGFIFWLLGLAFTIAFIALIVWVVKKVWYAGTEHKGKKQKTHNNWYEEAHERQNKRWEYSDPIYAKTEPKSYPSGWTFNEETKIWDPPENLQRRKIAPKEKELSPQPPRGEIKWHPNGWYYDEKIGKWTGPDFETEEEKQQKELRKQKYLDRRKAEGQGLTYEEWRAARLAEQQAQKHQDE